MRSTHLHPHPRPGAATARGGRTGFTGGFTLMETALALVIVGTGVLASMQLFATCSDESNTAINATTARMLGENIREAMANLAFADPVSGTARWGPEDGESLASYDDIDDFDGPPVSSTQPSDGELFSPPIDSMRAQIPALSKYRQVVTVVPVNPTDPAGNADEAAPTLPKGTYTGALRVRVRVQYRAYSTAPWVDLYTTSWVRANN
jgi:hypothetical protein